MSKFTRIFITFALFGLCAGAVNAQSKQKVAVYVTGEADAGYKKVIGAKMVAAITQDANYAAVERTADFIAELNKEQDYQRSGAVNDNQIVKLGEQFGVRFVVVVDVSELFGSAFISARMINVQTGLITATAERDKEINGMADLTKLSEDVASGLIGSIQKSLFGLEIRMKTSSDTKTPEGWRIPTADDLVVLSKFKTELKGVIPFKTYKSNTHFNYMSLIGLYSKALQGTIYSNNIFNYDCGRLGFWAVDMEMGNKYEVTTREVICGTSYTEDVKSRSINSDLQFPPFYVR